MVTALRTLLVGCVLCVGAPALRAQSRPFDFRGVRLGQPRAAFSQALPAVDFKCEAEDPAKPDRLAADTSCYSFAPGTSTYAGAQLTSIVLYQLGNGVEGMLLHVEESEFDALRTALTEKFGKPSKVDRYRIRAAPSAPNQQMMVEWRLSGAKLLLVRLSGGDGSSSLHVTGGRLANAQASLEWARKAARKRDMD